MKHTSKGRTLGAAAQAATRWLVVLTVALAVGIGAQPLVALADQSVEPAPTEPVEPASAEPVEPASAEPVEPAPTEPVPVASASAEPVEPASAEPVAPAPTEPVPVASASAEPVEPASAEPVEPAPTEPVEPASAEPAPATSEPAPSPTSNATSTDSTATSTATGSARLSGAADGPDVSIQSAHSPVLLGTAESFAVLGGSTVTNTGPTVISGDLGVFPGCEVTGSAQIVITGTIHECDAVAQQAQADLLTAYNAAAGQIPTAQLATELGGQTLTAGVYDSASGTFQITGILTLDAQGDPDAVFIFQTDSTLITASSSQVLLINGAQACNVFWQVGSSATLGTDSSLVGNVLALTSITANTGATVDGRLLALNGAVTLDTNVVTRSECAADNGNGDNGNGDNGNGDNGNGDNGNGDNGGPGPGGTDTGGTDTDTGTVLVTDTDTGTGTGTGEGTGTADDGRALPFTGLGIGLPGVIAMVMLLLGAGLRRIRGGGGTDGSPVGTTLAVRTASTATSARIAREVPPFHARESHQAERVLPFRPRVRLPAVIGGMAFLLAVGLRRRHVG